MWNNKTLFLLHTTEDPLTFGSNMSGVMALQRHALNLFYSVSKFLKNSATLKVLITVRKYLCKLIVKSIPKFPWVSKIWKWKNLYLNYVFLCLFHLILDSFENTWWQNPKRALVLNHKEIINI